VALGLPVLHKLLPVASKVRLPAGLLYSIYYMVKHTFVIVIDVDN